MTVEAHIETPESQAPVFLYLGRQAIFDAGLDVYAYELLFRSGTENHAEFENGDVATAQVLANTFMELGLDTVTGQRPAFVNLSREFIMSDFPDLFPSGRIALEVLEDVVVDATLLARLRELQRSGFKIVLDDFEFQPGLDDLVDLADIVKLDVLGLDEAELRARVEHLQTFDVSLLAEKIATYEEFLLCKDLGFDYFQGFFLCRPQIISGQRLPANRLGLMNILARVNDPNVDIQELEDLISRDVALSYRLLRYINSAYFALPSKVSSIQHAVVLLGKSAIRSWVNLVILAGIVDKPHEVLTTAMLRAKTCQGLASDENEDASGTFFTAGLFSTLDALMDRPMPEIINELCLSEDLTSALLQHEGELGAALKSVLNWEQGRWDEVAAGSIEDRKLRDAYVEALRWVSEVQSNLVD